MEISEERHGDVVVLRVKETPWGQRLGMQDFVRERLSAGTRSIVIDLATLSTFHEPGVGEIVAAAAMVVREVGAVAIVRPRRGSGPRNGWDLVLGSDFGDEGSNLRAFESLDEALEFLARDTDGPPTDTTG